MWWGQGPISSAHNGDDDEETISLDSKRHKVSCQTCESTIQRSHHWEPSQNLISFTGPRVIGALDCTNIRIKAPSGAHEADFVNMKSFYSINVQVNITFWSFPLNTGKMAWLSPWLQNLLDLWNLSAPITRWATQPIYNHFLHNGCVNNITVFY